MPPFLGRASYFAAFSFLSLYLIPGPTEVQQVSAMATPKIRFITNRLCPFAQRTWIALEEKGLPYEMEEVSLYGPGGKPGWFLELNPRGQVPVLVIDDEVVTESDSTVYAICDIPAGSPIGRGDLDGEPLWLEWIQGCLIPEGKQAVQGGGKSKKAKLASLLSHIESEMQGPYLTGEFSAADILLAPFIQRIESDCGIDPEVLPRTKEWWDLVRSRPAVSKTIERSWWWWW